MCHWLKQLLSLFGFLFTITALGQTYPVKPIKVMIGFAAGGPTDVIARVLAQDMSATLGQSVVVENKAGANAKIATEFVAQSPADGYTLLFASLSHNVNSIMFKKPGYDPIGSFEPITLVADLPMILVTAYNSPIKSLPEFVKTASDKPGTISYSSSGNAGSSHLAGSLLATEANIDLIHVPFKGGTQPFQELLAGRVDVMIDTMTLTASLLKDKRVKLLATTAPKGSSPYPNVLTVADNYPGVTYESWLGVSGPANISPVIVERINKELRAIVNDADFRQRLIDFGGKPFASSPNEFKARVAKDIESLSRVAQKQNIRPE